MSSNSRTRALYNNKDIFRKYDENGLDPYINSKNTLKLNIELNFKKMCFRLHSGRILVKCFINIELLQRKLSNRTSSEFCTIFDQSVRTVNPEIDVWKRMLFITGCYE